MLPGGTFNHFAADLGVPRVADAIRALREGTAIRVDVDTNTASLGSYPSFVAKPVVLTGADPVQYSAGLLLLTVQA